jgi:hypothetical protein
MTDLSIVDAAEEVVETVASLPEDLLIGFLRSLRQQSNRDDVLGAASRRRTRPAAPRRTA